MIVVFGSINADLFVTVPELPKPGETVLSPGYVMRPGGKGANQAVAAARAGGDVRFVGLVGKDPFGQTVLRAIKNAGVDTTPSRQIDDVTGTAMVMVNRNGENQIVVASGANQALTVDYVPAPLLTNYTVLVLQMEVPIDANESLIRMAKSHGARVVLNLAPAYPISEQALDGVDVLVMNEEEAAALVGEPLEPARHCRMLARKHGTIVIITLGGKGAVMFGEGGVWQVGTLDIDPVDTVGAGDAFVGAFAAALDKKLQPRDALHRASVAAGLACLAEGAQTGLPTEKEISSVLPRLAPPTMVS